MAFFPCSLQADAAAASYITSVAEALRRVKQEPVFRTAAAECGRKITEAGGVQRTVDILLQTGRERPLPTLLANTAPTSHTVKECRVQA